jgi:hypothetical protein
MKLLPLALLTVAALAALSCRSAARDGAIQRSTSAAATGSATPPVNPPSILPAGVLQTLRRYAITQVDLASGFTAGGVLEIPNEQAASDYADPEDAARELREVGRSGGLGQQVFPPGGDPSQIGVSIELFSEPSGAMRWASAPPDLPAAINPSPVRLDRPPGDGASGIHWERGTQAGYVVNFSRDRVAYGIGVTAPTGKESLETALDIARRIDQRIQSQAR